MMNARRHTFANTHMTLVSAPPQAKRDKQLQKGAEACARLSAGANGLLKYQRTNSRHPASHRHQGRGGSRSVGKSTSFCSLQMTSALQILPMGTLARARWPLIIAFRSGA